MARVGAGAPTGEASLAGARPAPPSAGWSARAAQSVALPLGFLLAWELVSSLGLFPAYIVPSFRLVITAFLDLVLSGEIFYHIGASLIRVTGGIVVAIALGVPLGVAIGWSRALERLFESLLSLLRQIPPIAWIPFALMWFKGGLGSAVFVVFMGALFPILLNSTAGVQSASGGLLEVGYTMGCTNSQLLRKIVLPAAVPFVLTGIRVAMGVGWACVVAAEFFGYKYGLGALITMSYEVLRMDRMIVGMFFIGIVGFLMDRGFRRLESRLFRWKGQ